MASRRRIAAGLLGLILFGSVLIFVLMHSGSRAHALCEHHGFSGRTGVKGQQESPLVASEFPMLVAAWRTAAAGMAA